MKYLIHSIHSLRDNELIAWSLKKEMVFQYQQLWGLNHLKMEVTQMSRYDLLNFYEYNYNQMIIPITTDSKLKIIVTQDNIKSVEQFIHYISDQINNHGDYFNNHSFVDHKDILDELNRDALSILYSTGYMLLAMDDIMGVPNPTEGDYRNLKVLEIQYDFIKILIYLFQNDKYIYKRGE